MRKHRITRLIELELTLCGAYSLCSFKLYPNYPYLFIYRGIAGNYELRYGTYGEYTASVYWGGKRVALATLVTDLNGELCADIEWTDDVLPNFGMRMG